ncbi:MAG: ribonuclease P protein component [Nitrospinota bacterium]|nr:ribonuclease P protein component [Nitrospinota bacterium]
MRFPPNLRIRSASDFSVAMKKGKKYETQLFSLYVSENSLNKIRLGLVVSKNVGNSVRRNRAKRLLREVFKKISLRLECGFEIVVVAKPEINECNFEDIKNELDDFLSFYKNIKGSSR